ncbi:shikimate kinase [Meridianimaribacter sp. CL38]|uniref:shikimate kinase n=1 Tax=Meridianimaribacter sp. CL38 TaxID=2213021 RepID=UPI00103FABE4|nr:shikimate kinase [Meridianimaribacter sp. CL38]TBV24813.1 shikimate kinase [Meridianimaribacter sp. CL38]
MNFFLIGYMGSGKSTIGSKLAQVLDYNFIDFDDYIQFKEKKTITEIFQSKGEIYFRKIENIYLKELIEDTTNTIISLGGGTPCYGNNMELIKASKHAKSIYLKASIPVLTERLFNEKGKRPLIAHIDSKEEMVEFIGKHLFERTNYYNQSDATILTDNKSIEEITEKIILELF